MREKKSLILDLAVFDSTFWELAGRPAEWYNTKERVNTLFCWLYLFLHFIYCEIDSNTLDLPKLVDCPWYFALYSSLFLSLSLCYIIYYMFNIIAVVRFFSSLLPLLYALNYVFMSFFSHSSLLVYQNVFGVCFFFFFRFWKESKEREKKKREKKQTAYRRSFVLAVFGRDIFIKDCCICVTSSLIFSFIVFD